MFTYQRYRFRMWLIYSLPTWRATIANFISNFMCRRGRHPHDQMFKLWTELTNDKFKREYWQCAKCGEIVVFDVDYYYDHRLVGKTKGRRDQ